MCYDVLRLNVLRLNVLLHFCRHISPAAKVLAAAVQKHLRENEGTGSFLPVWDKRKGNGFW